MHANLPSWLKQKCVEDNKLNLRYMNGSQSKQYLQGQRPLVQEALSLLILDEIAFIDKIDEIWTASQQTLTTGGSCIALSTPNGVGNWFHKTWVEAKKRVVVCLIRLNYIGQYIQIETKIGEMNKILYLDRVQ